MYEGDLRGLEKLFIYEPIVSCRADRYASGRSTGVERCVHRHLKPRQQRRGRDLAASEHAVLSVGVAFQRQDSDSLIRFMCLCYKTQKPPKRTASQRYMRLPDTGMTIEKSLFAYSHNFRQRKQAVATPTHSHLGH
jgi:hypothetical protein